jgi:hypothetical protein
MIVGLPPFRPPTGDLSDPQEVAHYRDQWLPPTAFSRPTIALVDLSGKLLSPASLRELVVPLGQRIRGGEYGQLRLVVATADSATREILGLLSRQYEIPLFIAESPAPADIERAVPAGNLTHSDVETLALVLQAGRFVTASAFAHVLGIAPTAANNRLVNLERKGYLYRVRRPRRYGDLFVDPRYPRAGIKDGYEAAPMTEVLVRNDVATDPYDTSDLHLEGKVAERAAEILRRHGKVN